MSTTTTNTVQEPGYVYFNSGGIPQKRPILTGSLAKPTFTSIPSINVSKVASPVLSERQALAKEVGKAVRETGFFYAVGLEEAGVKKEAIDDVFEQMAQFFALPKEEKLKVHTHHSPAARGYEPLWETRLDSTTAGDLKESFIVGDDYTEPTQAFIRAPSADEKPMNIWPSSPAAFRPALTKYYIQAFKFARSLLRIYALALGLEENALDEYFECPIVGANCLHYPPQEVEEGGEAKVGLGAHADYSMFTLVLQSTVGGIEVLNDNAHFISAPPRPYTFLVNVGDYLQILSNGTFRSTVHRVRNLTGEERYSLPMFFSPDPRSTIKPLKECVGEEGEKFGTVKVEGMHVQRVFASRYQHPTAKLLRDSGLKTEELKYEMLQGRF